MYKTNGFLKWIKLSWNFYRKEKYSLNWQNLQISQSCIVVHKWLLDRLWIIFGCDSGHIDTWQQLYTIYAKRTFYLMYVFMVLIKDFVFISDNIFKNRLLEVSSDKYTSKWTEKLFLIESICSNFHLTKQGVTIAG